MFNHKNHGVNLNIAPLLPLLFRHLEFRARYGWTPIRWRFLFPIFASFKPKVTSVPFILFRLWLIRNLTLIKSLPISLSNQPLRSAILLCSALWLKNTRVFVVASSCCLIGKGNGITRFKAVPLVGQAQSSCDDTPKSHQAASFFAK